MSRAIQIQLITRRGTKNKTNARIETFKKQKKKDRRFETPHLFIIALEIKSLMSLTLSTV